MLTPKQIERIAKDGWQLRLSRRRSPFENCGECFPETKQVVVYLRGIADERDLGITLIHEGIHLRDEYLYGQRKYRTEEAIDMEAEKTFDRYPNTVRFIRDLMETS